MRQSHRTERLADLLLREISETVLRVAKDPRLQGVTLTLVKVSGDLRQARVYYSVIGDAGRQREAAAGLESAKGLIKRELGRHLRLRYMPDIEFFFDDTLQYAEHIQKLLKGIESPES